MTAKAAAELEVRGQKAVAEAEECAAAAVLEAEGVWFRVEHEGERFGRGPVWI